MRYTTCTQAPSDFNVMTSAFVVGLSKAVSMANYTLVMDVLRLPVRGKPFYVRRAHGNAMVRVDKTRP